MGCIFGRMEKAIRPEKQKTGHETGIAAINAAKKSTR